MADDGFSVIGRPRRLDEGRAKVTGQARYATDVRLADTLYAQLVLSPHAHARIKGIDSAPAEALAGVVEVVTGADLAELNIVPRSRARSLLARERVVFAGQPVAAVLADSESAAADGVDAVVVDYEPLPAAIDPLSAMEPNAPRVWPDGLPGDDWDEAGMHGIDDAANLDTPDRTNVSSTVRFTRGDVEAGLSEADVVVEYTFRTPMVHQGYLEPHAVVAATDPVSGSMTIYTGTQAQFYVRSEVADVLGVPESDVVVVPTAVGGAFGAKFALLEPLVAVLARRQGRPVRLVLTRGEEFLTTTPAPQGEFRIAAGARRDGALTALRAHVVFDSGAWPGTPVSIACLLLGAYYQFPNLAIEGIEVLTNKPAAGAYRAPGAPQATLAIESVMDELARRLEVDPIDFRLRHASQEGDPMPNDSPWPYIGLKACLEELRAVTSDEAEGKAYRGTGIAAGGWPGGVQPAAAACQLHGDGMLTISVGSVDISGTHTGFAAIAAEVFGVSPEQVRIVAGDSASAPYAGGSGGSKVTYTVGTAVMRAAEEAREQTLSVAADYLEARLDDLVIDGDAIHVRGVPDQRVTLAEIGAMSRRFGGQYEPIFGQGRSAITARAPGFAAHCAVVDVDPATGEITVVSYTAVQDVGRAINPLAVQGQMHGGAAQSIGWALHEEMIYSEPGNLLTGTFMDYALPHIDDVPSLMTKIVELPSPEGPFGARGVGEPPVIPGAAAIANAVRDAIGVRPVAFPMTPARVRALIRQHDTEGKQGGAS